MQVTTKEAISILRIALVAEGQTTVEEERTRAAQHDLELALQDKRARAELNRRGLSQKKIAVACGVVSQTVYTELRRRRERLNEEGAAK